MPTLDEQSSASRPAFGSAPVSSMKVFVLSLIAGAFSPFLGFIGGVMLLSTPHAKREGWIVIVLAGLIVATSVFFRFVYNK